MFNVKPNLTRQQSTGQRFLTGAAARPSLACPPRMLSFGSATTISCRPRHQNTASRKREYETRVGRGMDATNGLLKSTRTYLDPVANTTSRISAMNRLTPALGSHPLNPFQRYLPSWSRRRQCGSAPDNCHPEHKYGIHRRNPHKRFCFRRI